MGRSKLLAKWLLEIEARVINKHVIANSSLDNDPSIIEIISCKNGACFILYTYADDNGWDIYVPASLRNSVIDTFKGAEKALGIKS